MNDGEKLEISRMSERERITVHAPKKSLVDGMTRVFEKYAALQEAKDRRLAEMFEQMEADALFNRAAHAAKVARPIAEVLRDQTVHP